MKRFIVGLAVLLIHSAALAQQPYYPGAPQYAQPAYPPGYGPPPGYAAPPAYYVPAPTPPVYYPPPAPVYYPPRVAPRRNLMWRPFTLGLGGGAGWLGYTDVNGDRLNSTGGSLTAHMGFGLAPRLILLFDLEYTGLHRDSVDYYQVAELVGLQVFLGNRLFLKGGAGAAQHACPFPGGNAVRGGALMGGVGFELLQGWNWSLAAEWTGTVGFYKDEDAWTNNGLNLVLNFY